MDDITVIDPEIEISSVKLRGIYETSSLVIALLKFATAAEKRIEALEKMISSIDPSIV